MSLASRVSEPFTSVRPAAIPFHRRILSRFLRHRLALAGFGVLLAIGLVALLVPWLSPYDPHAMNLPAARRAPDAQHWLGTDRLGRDILTRTLYAGRVSLSVALLAVAVSSLIGASIGLIAGISGGWIDAALMRLTDMFLSFPPLLFVIALMTIFEPGFTSVVVAISALSWMGTARLVRGQTLAVKQEQYIEAAAAVGAPTARIVLSHVLPNVSAPLLVATTLNVANAILTEAALSFLGLGIQPPTPSWGNMLNSAQQLQSPVAEPWSWLGPGLAITLTVLSINAIGDGLRDALDPRARSITFGT
jgi:peptide/nickel transport system permease protein